MVEGLCENQGPLVRTYDALRVKVPGVVSTFPDQDGCPLGPYIRGVCYKWEGHTQYSLCKSVAST